MEEESINEINIILETLWAIRDNDKFYFIAYGKEVIENYMTNKTKQKMNKEIVEQIKENPTKYTYKEWAKIAKVLYRTMHGFFYKNGLKAKESSYPTSPIVLEYIMEHAMEKTAIEWADYYGVTENQIRHYTQYRGIKVKSGFGAKLKAKKEKALLIDDTPLAPDMVDFQWVHPSLSDYGLGSSLNSKNNG